MQVLFASVIVTLVCIQTAFSQASVDEQSNEMETSLANCAGVYSAMSNVMSGMEKTNAAKTFEDTARGAYLAAAFSSHMSGKIPKWENALTWSENIHETRKTYWLGLFELYTPTTEKAFPDEYMRALDYCAELNPIQTKIINMMRESIYSQE